MKKSLFFDFKPISCRRNDVFSTCQPLYDVFCSFFQHEENRVVAKNEPTVAEKLFEILEI